MINGNNPQALVRALHTNKNNNQTFAYGSYYVRKPIDLGIFYK